MHERWIHQGTKPTQFCYSGLWQPGSVLGIGMSTFYLSNWKLPTGFCLEIERSGQGKPVDRCHNTPISFVQNQHLTVRVLGQVCSFWLGQILIIKDVRLSRRMPHFLSSFWGPGSVLRRWHAFSHWISHLGKDHFLLILILLMEILQLSPLTYLRSQ